MLHIRKSVALALAFSALALVPANRARAAGQLVPASSMTDAQLLQLMDSPEPVRCFTPYALEMQSRGLVEPESASALADSLYEYLTPEGHFRVTYKITGPRAVDLTDNDSSGVPDYVERTGSGMERSWSVEIDSLGFPAPDLGGGRYLVTLDYALSSFGETILAQNTPGGSLIKIRYSMDPFCTGTDDTTACRTQALLVTAAHEFKHALQNAEGWALFTVGGWIELDAMWVEDLVYDDFNDYYDWIDVGSSPFIEPSTSLMNALYDDCTWEHFLSEGQGVDFVVDFSAKLAADTFQPAQLSYFGVANDRALDWPELWGDYTVATYLTGARAVAGLGFEEAAGYPLSTTVAVPELPMPEESRNLQELAMRFYQYSAKAASGHLNVHFSGDPVVDWSLRAVFQRADKTVVEAIPLVNGVASFETRERVQNYDRVALLVGNSGVPASTNAINRAYTISADLSQSVPSVSRSLGSLKGRFGRPSEGQ